MSPEVPSPPTGPLADAAKPPPDSLALALEEMRGRFNVVQQRGAYEDLQALRHLEADAAQALELQAFGLLNEPLGDALGARALLVRASELLDQARAAQAPMAEAAAWRALQRAQLLLKLFKPALQSAAAAATLYEAAGHALLAGSMRASRCRVLYTAEMYAELREACAELLQSQLVFSPAQRHELLNNAASAAYYIANEQLSDASALCTHTALPADHEALWQECIGLHGEALDWATAQGLERQAHISRFNLAVVAATLGRTAECREQLAVLERSDMDDRSAPGWSAWLEHCELLLQCHESGAEQAWPRLLQAERALAVAAYPPLGLREATLQAIERFGLQWGHFDEALRASQTHLQLQRQLASDLNQALGETFSAVLDLPRLEQETEQLARQGSALEASLLQRNAELSHALAQLSTEASIRRAAEQALQHAHDDLERQVAERSAELEAAMGTVLQQEKQLALSRMAVGMAHEMNTPLDNARMSASVIRGRSQELKALLDKGSLRRSDLLALQDALLQGGALMQRALERVSQLLQRLSSLAQGKGHEQAAEFDLSELLRAAARDWQPRLRQRAVQLRLDLPEHAWMHGYPEAIRQVLQQLLENSLQHGLAGRPDGVIALDLRPTPQTLELCWQDNGEGVSDEHVPRVFEPFFTTQLGRSGAGLGLASVHSLVVDLMAGSIKLHSGKGQGFKLQISLPCRITASNRVPQGAADLAEQHGDCDERTA